MLHSSFMSSNMSWININLSRQLSEDCPKAYGRVREDGFFYLLLFLRLIQPLPSNLSLCWNRPTPSRLGQPGACCSFTQFAPVLIHFLLTFQGFVLFTGPRLPLTFLYQIRSLFLLRNRQKSLLGTGVEGESKTVWILLCTDTSPLSMWWEPGRIGKCSDYSSDIGFVK